MDVQGRPHSLSSLGAFHFALIAFVCAAMALLSGSVPAHPVGADGLTRQVCDRVEQVPGLNHATAPVSRLDIRFAEDLLEEGVELAEPTDDDETKHYLPRSGVAAFKSQAGLYETSVDRAVTRFRLRAFSSRGSPSV